MGAKVKAVWAWKNELPEMYPDDIYYGKIPGGHTALMTMQHLRETHYAIAYKPIRYGSKATAGYAEYCAQ